MNSKRKSKPSDFEKKYEEFLINIILEQTGFNKEDQEQVVKVKALKKRLQSWRISVEQSWSRNKEKRYEGTAHADILELGGLTKKQQNKALKIGLLTMQIHDLNENHSIDAEERSKMKSTRENLIEELLKQK